MLRVFGALTEWAWLLLHAHVCLDWCRMALRLSEALNKWAWLLLLQHACFWHVWGGCEQQLAAIAR
jgi:hypothetical protein